MIVDSLDHSSLYEEFHLSFPKAFAWLRAMDCSVADGRYEVDDRGTVAIVERYETAPATVKKWETHRVHGDIQYLISGSEFIGYAPRETLAVRIPYNPEKDAEFYEPLSVPATTLLLTAGSFAVFHPHDAHQPGVMIDQPGIVTKVVIKFRL